jgi:hypothetical protein
MTEYVCPDIDVFMEIFRWRNKDEFFLKGTVFDQRDVVSNAFSVGVSKNAVNTVERRNDDLSLSDESGGLSNMMALTDIKKNSRKPRLLLESRMFHCVVCRPGDVNTHYISTAHLFTLDSRS